MIMPFKKLHPFIKEVLEDQEKTTPTPFQQASIPVIKSGANVYCTAQADSGKTTTLILTTLHKLKCEEVGSAPRSIILTATNEKAQALHDTFISYSKRNLRVYFCDEKAHIDLLKSEIFEGVDVLIGTPKIIHKLLLAEGINTTQLSIFNIDDADFLENKIAAATLLSITESIQKCQYVMYSEKKYANLTRFESYFMLHPKSVSV